MKRIEAHRVVRDFLATRPANESIFVAGDFNSVVTSNELIGRVVPGEAVSRTLERWENDSFHDWAVTIGGGHLDKLLVSSDLSGGTLRIEESRQSDHYPVSYKLS